MDRCRDARQFLAAIARNDTAAAPTHDSFFAQANAKLAGARKAAAAQSAG